MTPAVAMAADRGWPRWYWVSQDNTGDVRAGPVSLDELARRFTPHAHDASRGPTRGAGDHQVTNALCAAAVALECGASVEQVAAAPTPGAAGVAASDAGTTRGDG